MIELDVLDRIALLSLLPSEGNFLTLRIVRELRESLSFTDEEHEAVEFRTTEDGRAEWSNNVTRVYDFRKPTLKVIEEVLRKADKDKKLTLDHLSVYEKFIGEDED